MIEERTSLGLYYNDVGKHALLTRDEELHLGRQVRAGGKAKTQAVDKLVKSNLRLVVKIAGEFRNRGLDFEDLISEGNIGLFTAAKKFDPNKGARFSYYSSFWIRQSMFRAISNTGRLIRVPVGSLEKYFKIAAYISQCKTEKSGVLPTTGEIAEKFNLTKKRVAQILEAVGKVMPLDSAATKETGSLLRPLMIHEVISDQAKRRPDMTLGEKEEFSVLYALLDKLPKREKFIIENRFGLCGGKKTLEVLGLKLKLTKERIRQLESIALNKLKKLAKDKLCV